MTNIIGTVTRDRTVAEMIKFTFPFTLFLYTIAVFSQPRRRSPAHMWKLRLHFASYAYISQGSWAIYEFVESEGDWIGSGFAPIILAAVQTGLFHLCLKLRAAIG